MKKNKRKNKNNIKKKNSINILKDHETIENSIIDVSNKKNISVVDYNIENIDDIEYKRLLNELEDIESNIRKTYYSSNISIEQTIRRTFFDLIKLFLSSRI